MGNIAIHPSTRLELNTQQTFLSRFSLGAAITELVGPVILSTTSFRILTYTSRPNAIGFMAASVSYPLPPSYVPEFVVPSLR
jgi:hypothetical protein